MWWLNFMPRLMRKYVFYAKAYRAIERDHMSRRQHLTNAILLALAQVLVLICCDR